MLSMSDAQLTNVLLGVIGALLAFMIKSVREWCQKIDSTVRDHERRITNLEARQEK